MRSTGTTSSVRLATWINWRAAAPVLAAAALGCWPGAAWGQIPAGWEVVRVTDNEYDDYAPEIDGDRIAWRTRLANGDYQIFRAELSGLGEPPVGACCMGSECDLRTEEDCRAAGGRFLGAETSCEGNPCPVGAAPGWSQYQHDARHSGQSDAATPAGPAVLWRFAKGAATYELTPPISKDGIVYVSGEGTFMPMRNGAKGINWLKLVEGRGTPAIRADGDFFAALDGISGKFDDADGEPICSGSLSTTLPIVLDGLGYAYAATGGFDTYDWSLRKAGPDCTELWRFGARAPYPDRPFALSPDDGIYIVHGYDLKRIDALTGELDWSVPFVQIPSAPAVAEDGTVYLSVPGDGRSNPSTLFAVLPDGTVRWSQELSDLRFESRRYPPAIARDGTVYVPGRRTSDRDLAALVAVSSEGVERWYFEEPTAIEALAPALFGDGTVLLPTRRGVVIALEPASGTEVWRVDVNAEHFRKVVVSIDGGNRRIDADTSPLVSQVALDLEGTVDDLNVGLRVPHERVGDLIAQLRAPNGQTSNIVQRVCGDHRDFDCLLLDDEAVRDFQNDCEDGFCDAYRPTVPLSAFDEWDANGTWTLYLLDVVDGAEGTFEEWSLELTLRDNVPLDVILEGVSIDRDGTIYAVTQRGFLYAIGDGCPSEPEITPRFTYRRVVGEGDSVRGLPIEDFEGFTLSEQGLITLGARVRSSGPRVSIVEEDEASLRAYAQLDVLDGWPLSQVYLPRRGANGDLYLPAQVEDLGPAVFLNDQLYVSLPLPEYNLAPIRPYALSNDFFDVNTAGGVLLRGQAQQGDGDSILEIVNGNRLDVEMSVGERIDEYGPFGVTLDLYDARQINAAGSYVVAGSHGIARDGALAIRPRQRIDGYPLHEFFSPQLTDDGTLYFLARHGLQKSVFSETNRIVGEGDAPGGHTIQRMVRFEANRIGDVAYVAELADGRVGVYLNDLTVALPGETYIDGRVVEAVSQYTLSHTDSGKIGFVATVEGRQGLYVAELPTAPGGAFEYRRALQAGDPLREGFVTGIVRIDGGEDGRVTAMVDWVPGLRAEPPSAGGRAAVVERVGGGFDAILDGDTILGREVFLTSAPPRFDAAGNVYHHLYLNPVGPAILRNLELPRST
jgi:outer membrane protein assembly factor BamB